MIDTIVVKAASVPFIPLGLVLAILGFLGVPGHPDLHVPDDVG